MSTNRDTDRRCKERSELVKTTFCEMNHGHARVIQRTSDLNWQPTTLASYAELKPGLSPVNSM